MTRSTSSVPPVAAALTMLTGAYAAAEFSAWQPVTPKNTCNARHETTAVAVDEIVAGKWSTLAQPMPTPRAGAPTVVRDGRVIVIVIGGESGITAKAHGEVEALLAATGDWETLAPMGEPRQGGGAAFVTDDLNYAAGCSKRGGGSERTTVEKLA